MSNVYYEGPGARCSRCNTIWFLGEGRTASYPSDWVGPCCVPLDAEGRIRDLVEEVGI